MSQSQNHHAWADLAAFENLAAGQAFEAFLKAQGFDARTCNDNWLRCLLFLRPPQKMCRVQIRENHFVAACALLQSAPPPVLESALHCPACGSVAVNYPQMTRKFVLPTILWHLGIIFRIVHHQCYCEKCHEMWTLSKRDADLRERPVAKPFPF